MMEPNIGEVSLFPYDFEPQGWARCDGRLLSIKDNTALFSLIGNRYGGDARTNFALPEIAPLPAVKKGDAKLGYFIALNGIYPYRP